MNIYYVGAKDIASYLVTTPDGHILIDSGTREMESVIRENVGATRTRLVTRCGAPRTGATRYRFSPVSLDGAGTDPDVGVGLPG